MNLIWGFVMADTDKRVDGRAGGRVEAPGFGFLAAAVIVAIIALLLSLALGVPVPLGIGRP
jgi:hypothetical protein